MTILHLGVIDIPYDVRVPESMKRVAVRTQRGGKAKVIKASPSGGQTTGDVAEILEDKYHIMEVFFEDIGYEAVMGALVNSLEGAIENIQSGAPLSTIKLYAGAESEIETAFRLFLGQQELDGVMPGVPTKAALKGVNHRMVHPYAKRGPRPSFIDTGLYQASFKAWVEE